MGKASVVITGPTIGNMGKNHLFKTEEKKLKPLSTTQLALLSVPLGILTGLGAVFFRSLIALFHNLFFSGQLSIFYDATTHTPTGFLGPFVILVPVIGAAGVSFLVKILHRKPRGMVFLKLLMLFITVKERSGQLSPL